MKSEHQLTQNWFIFNVFSVFNVFGSIDFVLVLFPLCLFWTYIFLAKNGTNQLKWSRSIITFAFRGDGAPLKCKHMQTGRERDHFNANVRI